MIAAWETEGRIALAFMDQSGQSLHDWNNPTNGTKQRHPAVSADAAGHTLVAWTEYTGWNKGEDLVDTLLDEKGTPMGEPSRHSGVPVWSFPAVVR